VLRVLTPGLVYAKKLAILEQFLIAAKLKSYFRIQAGSL
jgi:hypothetical protein